MIKKFFLKLVDIWDFFPNIIILQRKHVSRDKSLEIRGRIKIHGNGRINIGKNVKINSSEASNPIGGSTFTVFSLQGGYDSNRG